MAKKAQKRTNAGRAEHRSPRRRKMTVGEKLGAVGAVIGALAIIICMVLYIPFIKVDGEQISLMQMFKDSKPLESMEGELSSKTFSYEVRSEVDSTLDDGLDLDQLVEGQFTILFCGFDEGRSNTDVNMLAVCDIAANTINILQIPRDSYVPDYTSFKAGKFNSVYSMGDSSKSKIQRTVDCVEETFGIPVDRYVTTGCADIVDIVDLMGGVEVDMPYTIQYEADKIINAGPQVLSGQKAEWLVRYRHGYNEGDIGRMQAQRIFMAAMMNKVCETGTLTMMGYMKKIYDNQWIGTDLSIDEMSKLSDFAIAVGMENISMYMLPGEGYNYTPPGYKKPYSVYTIHKSVTEELLNEHFRPYLKKEYDLPITELVPEGSYKTSAYDNNNTNLEDVHNGDTFSGK